MNASLNVVLVEPEIPPNTGNIGRLCTALEIPLHLVGPLGFSLADRQLKRAGLDYWEYLQLERYDSLEAFFEVHPAGEKCHFFSKKANRSVFDVTFREGDFLFFGSETRGLPGDLIRSQAERSCSLPMRSPHVRSLNLSSAVAAATYEAWRQIFY